MRASVQRPQIAAFTAWLEGKEAAQSAKAAHEEPAFTSEEVGWAGLIGAFDWLGQVCSILG